MELKKEKMERKKGYSPCPDSAGDDTGSSEQSGDAPQMEENLFPTPPSSVTYTDPGLMQCHAAVFLPEVSQVSAEEMELHQCEHSLIMALSYPPTSSQFIAVDLESSNNLTLADHQRYEPYNQPQKRLRTDAYGPTWHSYPQKTSESVRRRTFNIYPPPSRSQIASAKNKTFTAETSGPLTERIRQGPSTTGYMLRFNTVAPENRTEAVQGSSDELELQKELCEDLESYNKLRDDLQRYEPYNHPQKRLRTDAFGPTLLESESAGDSGILVEAPVTAVNYSVTNTLLPAPSHLQPPPDRFRSQSCLSRSHSMPSLSQIPSAKNKTFPRAESLTNMLLKSSFEEFTPDITADEEDETFRFQSSGPGLYQCRVTGLVFHMEGEGEVLYRIVPWNRRLLAQHHKKPAGPLFDIKCVPQSVCQLHLPHCEIRSTGACHFLSVAHVKDKGIDFISPHKITETHVIINITGLSDFGIIKDEYSPLDPVRALVLLFYRPPGDPDPTSILSVLLLPSNVVLWDVQRIRKKTVGEESYIETSPHCKLLPQQEYTLSTCPEDDSVIVQPTEAEFDCDNYDNYFPSFQVLLETRVQHIKLILRDSISSHSVWVRRVCLSSPGVRRSCGQSSLNHSSQERLLDIRSSFIHGISGPVLKTLLDKLLEKRVLTDSEVETAQEKQNRSGKARFVIDTVTKKGEAASSEMMEVLCDADPFLSQHLGLI